MKIPADHDDRGRTAASPSSEAILGVAAAQVATRPTPRVGEVTDYQPRDGRPP